MTARRSLYLKLMGGVLAVFLISITANWFVQDSVAEKEAYEQIDLIFDDVQAEINACVNERLILQCMAVRERLEEGYPDDSASLQALARELRVTEICVADEKGDIVRSSVADYLAHDNQRAFNFKEAGGQAAEMMRLITGPDTEFCQPFRANSANGAWRKYVGVWKPTGGFVEIGCDADSLRSLSRSSIVNLFTNWRIASVGGIVVTSPAGLVLSDYATPNREGTQWTEPNEYFYWKSRVIDSFPTYVMIPKIVAEKDRDVLVATNALHNGVELAVVALLVGLLIAAFVRRQIQIQTEKELAVAKDIQLSALPTVFPPFPDETSFEIYASMATAKEVGGDFYDFYFTGARRIAFVIADVSGKGVPAAMFMMRAKTLLKSTAQTGKSLAEVVTETNDILCEGNEANMFVTVWIGELNLDTGVLTYVNAGHNPPVVRQNDQFIYLRERSGPALGVISGIPYKAIDRKISPGDGIYLYTDGITEQQNEKDELFGEAHLVEILKTFDGENQQALLDRMLAAVLKHANGVEQADDCTQLCIRYRGDVRADEHAYAPTMEDLARATATLEAALEGVPMKEQMQLMVAADEIFANIVRYSGCTKWTLRVERQHYPDGVRLIFTDDGKAFDPLAQRDPDTTLDAKERTIGGLGILIVKKTMSPVYYVRKNGHNILTMGLTLQR